jgi:hypothetical protein
MNIKNLITRDVSICEILDDLVTAVDSIGAGVPKNDVLEVIRRTPFINRGFSFPHFLLGLGSPQLAREKGAFIRKLVIPPFHQRLQTRFL